MQQLYLKRAKLFLLNEPDKGELRFPAGVTAHGDTVNAPDWVLQTDTYKWGIKDKSIVNLTPPKPMAAAPEPEPEPVSEDPEQPEEPVAATAGFEKASGRRKAGR